jgi:flagellar basal-body rod modification protein FlgD
MALDQVTGATTTPATTTPAVTTAGNKKTDGLGRDAFLSLLVTQLQHQDPLEPQADGEFLAQLAQFSSLESLQDIRTDMAALRSLIETGSAKAGS